MPYPVLPISPTGQIYEVSPLGLITSSNTAIAAAANNATLPINGTLTNYISGFVVSSHAPVSVVSGLVTVVGVISGTLNYQFVENVTYGGELIVTFTNPLPASAAGVAIVVALPAITGGAASTVTAFGYAQ
jgi:hypothetical protein